MREGKIVFHIDVNSAFLSWSAIERLKDQRDSVDLRTVPSVVGGDEETRHGVVLAKSTPAKNTGSRRESRSCQQSGNARGWW